MPGKGGAGEAGKSNTNSSAHKNLSDFDLDMQYDDDARPELRLSESSSKSTDRDLHDPN